MLTIVMTILLTTALNVALIVFVFRKVTAYFQGNAEAREKFIANVLNPLFRRKPEVPVQEETEQE